MFVNLFSTKGDGIKNVKAHEMSLILYCSLSFHTISFVHIAPQEPSSSSYYFEEIIT
jgi:hypothetical protein